MSLEDMKSHALSKLDLSFSESAQRLAGNPTPEMRTMWDRLEKWAEKYPSSTGDERARIRARLSECLPDQIVTQIESGGGDAADYMYAGILRNRDRNEAMMALAWKMRATAEFLIKTAATETELAERLVQISAGQTQVENDYIASLGA